MPKSKLHCVFCSDTAVVKNGQLESGGQRFKCKRCEKQFHIGGTRRSYTPDFKAKVVEEYLHLNFSARTLAKKYSLSTSTLLAWSKKHKQKSKRCQCQNS